MTSYDTSRAYRFRVWGLACAVASSAAAGAIFPNHAVVVTNPNSMVPQTTLTSSFGWQLALAVLVVLGLLAVAVSMALPDSPGPAQEPQPDSSSAPAAPVTASAGTVLLASVAALGVVVSLLLTMR